MHNAAEMKIDANLRWFANSLLSMQLPAAAGADEISVVEHWMPRGEAPPLHIHRDQDEVFHILEGQIRFRIGSSEIIAVAGETVLAPKGVAHGFRVESDGAHCLTITRGRDFETMVSLFSRPATSRVLPSFVAPSPAAIDYLMRCCAQNRIDLIGPPIDER